MIQTTDDRVRSGHDRAWLESRVRTWVEAGLITGEEAAAVQDYERRADEHPPRSVLGLPAEVGAYVGIVLALAGALVALQPHWQSIPLAAQFALAVCVAAVGFACGTWLVRIDEAGTDRLGMFLWALGSAGAALGSVLLVDAANPTRDGWIALAAGLPLLITGLVLWRNLERPLQLATWMAGFGSSLGGVGVLLGLDAWVTACIGWALAAGWWILTLRVTVRPLVVARCFGSVAALLCSFVLADLDQRLGSAAATLTGALVIALALWTRMIPVLIVGALGTLIATQSLVQTTLHGAGAGAALVLGGLLMVVTIAMRLRSRHSSSS
jgi:Predicted membrane protein (DUF2157)